MVFILRTLHKRIILLFVPYFAHLFNTFIIIILNKLLLLFSSIQTSFECLINLQNIS